MQAMRTEWYRAFGWSQLGMHITPRVSRIVEFAKFLPGFTNLSQDDQLILIKRGIFEVWLTRVARYVNCNGFAFDDGLTIAIYQLELIYNGKRHRPSIPATPEE
ncbi:Ecdysone-induced protein 78C [Eumeta japonica]|uniref:Ecdysone-induced protein 78C n=1 Tax=Eumeta variegata TaxID=151549 RepID=A0A4C1SBZ7_EUMVA|nr:Ecdysone-induced protein 78C [Eumeta japonica]